MKDYIVRFKLYPLEKNVDCWGCRNGICHICKNRKVTDTFDSFTTKKVAWTTSLAVKRGSAIYG